MNARSNLSEPLLEILKQYASLRPPRLLSVPIGTSFAQLHDFLMYWVLLNPHFKEYPPPRECEISLWKWAIQKLEGLAAGEDVDIDERIYSRLIELMPGSSGQFGTSPPSEGYVTYIWKAQDFEGAVGLALSSATLLESRTLIESGTTGLTTWSASLVLAEHLIAHPDLVKGKRILELGCGSGFLGIIVATLQLTNLPLAQNGGSQIHPSLWLTDLSDIVLGRCQENLKLPCNMSCHHTDLHCCVLDWADAKNPNSRSAIASLFREINADTILGADIVYDPIVIHDLVSSLHLALETSASVLQKSTSAYIALTVRNEDTLTHFLTEAGHLLKIQELVPDVREERSFTTEASSNYNTKLYKMTLQ